jgi:hypothetical protein
MRKTFKKETTALLASPYPLKTHLRPPQALCYSYLYGIYILATTLTRKGGAQGL